VLLLLVVALLLLVVALLLLVVALLLVGFSTGVRGAA
jgi:hypothetical protein